MRNHQTSPGPQFIFPVSPSYNEPHYDTRVQGLSTYHIASPPQLASMRPQPTNPPASSAPMAAAVSPASLPALSTHTLSPPPTVQVPSPLVSGAILSPSVGSSHPGVQPGPMASFAPYCMVTQSPALVGAQQQIIHLEPQHINIQQPTTNATIVHAMPPQHLPPQPVAASSDLHSPGMCTASPPASTAPAVFYRSAGGSLLVGHAMPILIQPSMPIARLPMTSSAVVPRQPKTCTPDSGYTEGTVVSDRHADPFSPVVHTSDRASHQRRDQHRAIKSETTPSTTIPIPNTANTFRFTRQDATSSEGSSETDEGEYSDRISDGRHDGMDASAMRDRRFVSAAEAFHGHPNSQHQQQHRANRSSHSPVGAVRHRHTVTMRRGVRGAPNLPARYTCVTCARRFARSAHLLRHQRIHTGEKPFTCFKCFHSYARGDYLRSHLTSQHNKTPMICEVCTEHFPTISELLDHQKLRHGRTKASFLQPNSASAASPTAGTAGAGVASSTSATSAAGIQASDTWSISGDVDDEERDRSMHDLIDEDEASEDDADDTVFPDQHDIAQQQTHQQ